MPAVLGNLFFTDVVQTDAANGFFASEQFNPAGSIGTAWSNVAGSGFVAHVARRARGVPGQEVALLAGDLLGSHSWQGFDGSVFTPTRATLVAVAAENWSVAAHGTRMSYSITALGAIVATEALRIDGSVTLDDIRLMVFDFTGGSLKRVSRGVADSGGVGFRVLRIPN